MAGKITFDASVSAKWVLDEEDSDRAQRLLGECMEDGITITVPPLWRYELDSIIRFQRFRGELTESQTEESFTFIDEIPVTVRYLPFIQPRARMIAAQARQRRVYDSVYAAHSEAEECVLWTADYEYFKAVRGFLPHVKYLGDL